MARVRDTAFEEAVDRGRGEVDFQSTLILCFRAMGAGEVDNLIDGCLGAVGVVPTSTVSTQLP